MKHIQNIVIKNISLALFVVILIIFGLGLLMVSLSKQEVFGEIVNQSGKLRMISQQMHLKSVIYNTSFNQKDKTELLKTVLFFKETNKKVVTLVEENSVNVDKLLLSHSLIKEYIFHIENFANSNDANSYRFIMNNSGLVLVQLDNFVTKCIKAQKTEIQNIILRLIGVLLFIFGIVVYYYKKVFSPMTQMIQKLGSEIDTERKKSKNIIDNVNSIIFTKNKSGEYTFVNKAFKLFLTHDQDVIGLKDSDIFDKQLAVKFSLEDEDVLKNNRAKITEYTIPMHGMKKTFYITKFPLKNEYNEPDGVCGIALDITAKKELETELKKYKDNLSQAQAIAKIGSFEFDIKSKYFLLSEQCSLVLGLNVENNLISFDECLKRIHSKDVLLVETMIQKVAQIPSQEIFEFRLLLDNGFIKIINVNIQSILDEVSNTLKVLGTVQDFTQKKETEKKLQEFNTLIDTYVISSTTDLDGIILDASEAFCKISGYTLDELIGKNHNIVRHPDMDIKLFEIMWETITRGDVWQGEVKNKNKEGGFYWVDTIISPIYGFNGQKIGYSSVRTDITDKKTIEIMSITDALTNLYNRRFFNELFAKKLSTAYREKSLFGFFIADIDNFKKYNDTYGHLAGDSVLTQVGEVFKNNLSRPQDYPFRLGGEEFGGIVNTMDIHNTIQYVEKLKMDIENLNIEHKLNVPYEKVTISIGLVIIDGAMMGEHLCTEKVYELADNNLYQAKHTGRNRVFSKVLQ